MKEEKILKTMQEKLKENLVSIISMTNDEWLIVVKEDTLDTLEIIGQLCTPPPLVLREKDIYDGLDIFAVDMLHIITQYNVLYGVDPFQSIDLEKKHIRHQLEFEIRSKLILLRTRFMSDPKKSPAFILNNTLQTMLPILKGLYAIKNTTLIPEDISLLLDKLEKEYKIDFTVLHNIYKNEKLTAKQQKAMVKELLDILRTLCDSVDIATVKP